MTKTSGTCWKEVCDGGGVNSSGLGDESELVEESVKAVLRPDIITDKDKK